MDFERYLSLNSPLHRWQPELKLIGLAALVIAFALVDDVRLVPVMLAIATALYRLSRLPWSLWWHQVRYPGLFMLGIVILLPFTIGETVAWQWGFIALRTEGLVRTVLIMSRFGAILTLGMILLGTSPFAQTIKAMRALGLPPVLADMILLSYRYLFEFAQMLATMQQSMRLRGFQNRLPRAAQPGLGQRLKGSMRRYAALTGTLLVRSYEQAQRSYQAMSLRGYGRGTVYQSARLAPTAEVWEHSALIVMLIVAGGFVVTTLL